MIRSGCRRVKELESRAMDFVTDVLFESACRLKVHVDWRLNFHGDSIF